ncbi:uncharacterized protein LOC117241296 [Bombus vosnesenskii]|uniref:Uncharacterized protein LOC117241296 n=1 Tax=Bombus vosnesenskii TaxID=207650 RepID=A0A6J3LC07_9HYME|nr:uncharacterized protein LOC117241296 [Bombus vosnesenskii]
MIEQGAMQPSRGPWASPLHIVLKKDGWIRPCGDYRARTTPDRYTPPYIEDFAQNLYGRLPVHVQHILAAVQDKSPETLTRIAGSIYEIHPEPGQVVAVSTDRMTAVSNPPAQNVGASDSTAAATSALRQQTIQIVSSTTGGISRHHSSAELREHHIETTLDPPVYKIPRRLAPDRLKQVKAEFELMIEQGVVRPSKSPWASPLHVVPKRYGNLLPCGDYRALNARMIPDRWCTPPHIEDFAPIYTAEDSFEESKRALADTMMLAHPILGAPISLTVDTPDYAVGAVLQQYVNNKWQPLGFATKSLKPAQQKHGAYDRELLAM